jgi:intein/homing endonuclease
MANQNKNPKNNNTTLFKRLTRIFSGPITNRRTQNYRRLRKKHMDKYASRFNSISGQAFKKSTYNPFTILQTERIINHNRAERYKEFDQMEYEPLIASSLDIYADEITTSTNMSPLIKIDCQNEEIKMELENLFYDVLNLDFNLYGWARTMCKYGDFCAYMDIDPQHGIIGAIGMPMEEIERLEGEDETNPNYVQFQWNSRGQTYEAWQMLHFRIHGNDKYAPYGVSVLEPARRIWRQLCLAPRMLVWGHNGPTEIQHIKAGDTVYSWSPDNKELRETKVVACKPQGKQDVYSVRTNHRTIDVTANHGLLVYDNKVDDYVYKKAKDIKTGRYGDRLILPVKKDGNDFHTIKLNKDDYTVSTDRPDYNLNLRKLVLEHCDMGYKQVHSFISGDKKISISDYEKLKEHIEFKNVVIYQKGSKNKAIVDQNLEFVIDKSVVRFLGFMTGDGWLNIARNSLGFALGIEEEQNEYYIQLFENICNKKVNSTSSVPGRGGQVNISSKEAVSIFKAMGFKTGALNKTIPSWIFGMSLKARRNFILGLFDADGGYSDGRLTSISKELMDGVKYLCDISGIPSGQVKQNKKAGTDDSGVTRQDSWRLYINMNQEKWHDEYILENVVDFTFSENVETWDLQVEDELHNFVVAGIVSHNTLLEDSMMAYRVVRAPERRVFYIDVGGIDPIDVEQYMEKIITGMKRHQIVDADTGRVDLRYNPLSTDEDFYIPVRGETKTRIETLPGGTYTGDIDDIQYLHEKLLAALKVPQSYLSRAEGAGEDKETLSQKDIRFARTVQRLQRSIVTEITKAAMIHLLVLGYEDEDINSFELNLNNPSKIAEFQELETWRLRFDIAAAATENFFSYRWVAKNVFNLSEEEIVRIKREQYHDAKFAAEINSIREGSEAMGEMGDDFGGGDLGDLGADLGDISSDEGGDLMDLDSELEGDGEPEDGELLSAPGKRDEYTKSRWKGKSYKPVQHDNRKTSGPRRKTMKRGNEAGMATKRKVFPGLSAMTSLGKGIVNENSKILLDLDNENSTYEEEEIFDTEENRQTLLKELREILGEKFNGKTQ